MSKRCERCGKEIPDHYVNLLCDNCYQELEADRKAQADVKLEDIEKEPEPPEKPKLSPGSGLKYGIEDPEYQENPEADNKPQWEANFDIFARNGVLLWKPTRNMYTFIKDEFVEMVKNHPQFNKFVWKPNVVDVGCGTGVGANVLSQEANFVWGIDKDPKSIMFAKEAFTREKNSIYYTAQVTFDNIDIMEDSRDFMRFDVVVAIEVIEHIYETHDFLTVLIRKFDNHNEKEPTIYYFSSPNRNNKSIKDKQPYNPYHVREWTSGELLKLLSGYFENVEMFNTGVRPIPKEEYETTTHTPLLFKCSVPKKQ